MSTAAGARVALVHDWLTGMRGGEKVLAAIAELYPAAPIFSLLHARGSVSPDHRTPRRQDVVRAATAQGDPSLSPVPAALPRRGRAFRPRRLRSGDQHQSLRGQVGDTARTGRARLLLPLTHALCLGSVRRLFRPGSGREGEKPAAPAGHGGAGALGRVDRGTGRQLSGQLPICCGQDPPIL